ncbi:hypothetical protein ABT160_41990 [Streptomyces sp. NPDC001941]|uniref:hypothetical protein n=1 Tax=Streptomyces sp. NPDC001941 TaxID=3154659 RepID=UPI00331D6FC1
MSKRILRTERETRVEYAAFSLGAFCLDSEPEDLPGIGADTVLATGRTVVVVRSQVAQHDAQVLVEVWDGEPGAGVDGELLGERVIEFPTGILAVTDFWRTPMGEPIPLGAPGGYRIRVGRTNRFAPEDLPGLRAGSLEPVEAYHVQVWPAGTVG